MKKKVEWSNILCGFIVIVFSVYGIWCGLEYYKLCQAAIDIGSEMPDPTLAVTCVSVVIGAVLSYLLYQMGLKNSRNKYGITPDGQPFKEKIYYEENTTEDNVG